MTNGAKWRQCDKKRARSKAHDAHKAARNIGGGLRAYQCHICDRWHLTSKEMI